MSETYTSAQFKAGKIKRSGKRTGKVPTGKGTGVKKASKYRNVKVEEGTEKFDSVKEYKRWLVLKTLERAGEISGLERQVKYSWMINYTNEANGKQWSKKQSYIADFTYFKNGKQITEDCKGYRTKEYIKKRTIMLKLFAIEILES